jgi:hypothetical protein
MSTRYLSKLFSFAQKQKVPAKPIKAQLALGTRHLALLFFQRQMDFNVPLARFAIGINRSLCCCINFHQLPLDSCRTAARAVNTYSQFIPSFKNNPVPALPVYAMPGSPIAK